MSKILKAAIPTRVKFNPKSKKHRDSLKCFLETGKWGEVLFVHELPHVEVPMTVLTKMVEYSLGIQKA